MDPTDTYRKAVINFFPASSTIPRGVDGVSGGAVKCGWGKGECNEPIRIYPDLSEANYRAWYEEGLVPYYFLH